MEFWLLIFTVVFVFLSFLSQKFQYWHWKGIKTLQNNEFVGNLPQTDTLHHATILQELYDSFKASDLLAGFYIYTKPVAVILRLDVIRSVLVTDFHKFANRVAYRNNKDLLSSNLSLAESANWQPLRSKLAATLTPAKMEYLFPTIQTKASQLNETFASCVKSEAVLNISDLCARFTIDSIAACMFGMECNSLKDPHNECRQIAAQITATADDTSVQWQLFKHTYEQVLQFLGFDVRRYPKCIEDFFLRSLREHLKRREKLGLMHNNLVDLLLDLRHCSDAEDKSGLTHQEMITQLFTFFLESYETSSAVLSYALYELARYPEAQEKTRQEICSTLKNHNNEFSYEASMEMPYLDQTISETIRLHPITAYLQRTASEDYCVPNSITLDKGTTVFIPIRSIHYDPEIYEYPKTFRPERFQPSEVAKRHPQAFLGFGDGPRSCIGQRVGRMQVTAALVSLLSNYRFSVCQKTVERFEFSKHAFRLKALNDVWLRVDKLEDICV